MITSTGNPRIKNIIQLNKKTKTRKEQGVFIVEGIKMFQEAPEKYIRKVYVSASFLDEVKQRALLEGVNYEVVEDKVFAQMSDTKTPQGILCVMRQFEHSKEELIKKEHPFLMILEDLQDPGNVGTIFRTAEGAGADGIILTKNCVDIYNPKTIRATMGSIYRVPFLYVENLNALLPFLREYNVRTYAAHLEGKKTYDQINYREGTAFFVGNEGNGLSVQISQVADCLIKIPMEGSLESLNAAAASAILMYEVHRQRSM